MPWKNQPLGADLAHGEQMNTGDLLLWKNRCSTVSSRPPAASC